MTKSTYSTILKTTSIIGGSQAITMVIGLIRTKLIAVLLGPSGVGLLSIYQSITGVASAVAGLGIQTSGVREIVRYDAQEDEISVARTVITIERVSFVAGIGGMSLLMLLAPLVASFSFGSQEHSFSIIVLAVTVLLSNITGAQTAVLQGKRRISDLARISILGSLFGTILAIGIYALLGPAGIVPTLVVSSAATYAISAYFFKRVGIPRVAVLWRDSLGQSERMVRLGFTMVLSAILGSIVAYATRVLITYEFNPAAVGIFSAAFSLSGLFVQFVLGAMGADFYPRLTAVANDNARMTQLINEQTEIGLLLAFPGLLGTIVFAPDALALFYTNEFAAASDLLTWFMFGCIGRVVSWPLGFGILAKGHGGLFLASETISHITHLGLMWIGIRWFGLVGVAIAFAVMNSILVVQVLLIVRQTIGFRWTKNVWMLIFWMTPVAFVECLAFLFLPQKYSLPLGLFLGLASSIQCVRHLSLLLGKNHKLPKMLLLIPGGNYILRGLW